MTQQAADPLFVNLSGEQERISFRSTPFHTLQLPLLRVSACNANNKARLLSYSPKSHFSKVFNSKIT